MNTIEVIKDIKTILEKEKDIEFRIINNTIGKNLILINKNFLKIVGELKSKYDKYIQEIVIETQEKDRLFIEEIKKICPKNSLVHRNISYKNWKKNIELSTINKLIAGYSFKGGMGRSSTLAYLAYFYYVMGKKVIVLDCDFEAPGIASIFFDKKERVLASGIIDYFIDLNIEDIENLNLSKYFLQLEVSQNSGNLYLFPTGIDNDESNYINKLSKIDFNSDSYIMKFKKLISQIDIILKPDLIFVDLRAGINESNGIILNSLSNLNLLFFNSEEQNEDGLKVIIDYLNDSEKNYIINSSIRYIDKELRNLKQQKFLEYFNNEINKELEIIPVEYEQKFLESDKDEFKKFIKVQYEQYKISKECFAIKLIDIINSKYNLESNFISDTKISLNNIDIESILCKLKEVFSKLTGTEKFKDEEDLKYFYLKDDIGKIINEQIFLILGAKGSGKSTLFEIFTKHHKDILTRLNVKNNEYIAGFSKEVIKNISKDYLQSVYEKTNKQNSNIERFWKCVTLFQIEQKLNIKDKYFNNVSYIVEKLNNANVGIEIDSRLKEINIELLKNDKIITVVYDELDIGFSEQSRKQFISMLISFWQDNIYKYSHIRSKILLRNDIFEILELENKTHLEFNMYELKWNEKEILSLILKIVIATLNDKQLDEIGLLFIVKNRKNNEVIQDIDKIIEAIYHIFGKKAPYSSTMEKWLIKRLSDANNLITPRTIYKLMFESIKNELSYINSDNKTRDILFKYFSKDWEKILKEVSLQKLDEYNAEYKKHKPIYDKIKNIGQRTFTKEEFKKQYKSNTSVKTIEKDLNSLISSGFLSYDEKNKKYQVAFIYVYALNLKINRSKTGLSKKERNNVRNSRIL